MKRISWFSLPLLALIGSLAIACGSGSASTPVPGSPVTLRLAHFPNVTHGPAFIGLNQGYIQEALGDQVTLDVKTFNAGPTVIEALFANQIDISYIGPNPAINGFVQSNGEALRIIAGSTSAGALFIVHPDSGIQTPADLAGKKITTPQLANTQDVALRAYLAEHGLGSREQDGNVQVIPTANADALSLFIRGEIDGAWVPEPWATRLILEGNGQVFLDERDLWPDGEFVTTHIIVRTAFLQERPDVVAAFLRGHLEALRFINESPDEAKVIINNGIAAISAALPQPVIDGAWANLTFTHDPIAASLQKSADDAYELGYLQDNPELSTIYALDLLNAILAESGLPPVAGLD